jgi:hypothetical protein
MRAGTILLLLALAMMGGGCGKCGDGPLACRSDAPTAR